MGRWLYREGVVPGCIVSSPAERARETTLKLCKSLDCKSNKVRWDGEIYEAGVEDLLLVLKRCPTDVGTVLMVGHNPGLEDLLRYLAPDDIDDPVDGKLLPTAAFARLEMPADWSDLERGCATLLKIVRPKQLK